MRTLRIYYPNLSEKQVGNKFALYEPNDIKHLKVLRADSGNYLFTVGDGKGNLGRATLKQLSNEGALFTLDEMLVSATASNHKHVLILPIIKPANLEIAIDQAVQFDIYSSIFLYFSDHTRLSKQEISPNKLVRFNKIALEAYKQSRALFLPEVEVMGKLKDTLPELHVESVLVPDLNEKVLNEKGINSWMDAHAKLRGSTAVVIGAEGGFSDKERDILNKAPNAIFYQLGQSILTTEAASTAFSALMASSSMNA